MSAGVGGKGRRVGLFAAIKNFLATLLAIGKTRAELLVSELEEEKYRLIALLSKALGALFCFAMGLLMLVICLAMAFWEQRVMLFGVLAAVFALGGWGLLHAMRAQAAQPSALFRASLAELDTDIAQLRRSSSSADPS